MIGIGDKYKRHKVNVIDLFGAYKKREKKVSVTGSVMVLISNIWKAELIH